MEFISKELDDYCIAHSSKEAELLQKLNRDTHANIMRPRMLSGHLQGKLLEMISEMIQPEHILEIGTYTGYAAICLCAGLKENGQLDTIDINEELEDFTLEYFEKAGLKNKINYLIGDAMEIIPTLDKTYDLVFIDADKENYLNYYEMVMNKVRPGGFILADNVLWSGKVLEEVKASDKDTRLIKEFNKKVAEDEGVEVLLLPFRDGISIIRKK